MFNPKKITAKEIMNDDLLTLREDTPIKEAVGTLEEYHISGAPVLNSGGECVGIFSNADVLKRDAALEEGETPRVGDYFSSDPFSEDPEEYFSREDYDEEVLGRDTVGQWMTPIVWSVAPGASLEEVCRQMVSERIHRTLVMEEKRLCGIISSFDVVRLVAGVEADRSSGHARRSR